MKQDFVSPSLYNRKLLTWRHLEGELYRACQTSTNEGDRTIWCTTPNGLPTSRVVRPVFESCSTISRAANIDWLCLLKSPQFDNLKDLKKENEWKSLLGWLARTPNKTDRLMDRLSQIFTRMKLRKFTINQSARIWGLCSIWKCANFKW